MIEYPIIKKTWVSDGIAYDKSPSDERSYLYIKPMLESFDTTNNQNLKIQHSLVLDSNVFIDLRDQGKKDANGNLKTDDGLLKTISRLESIIRDSNVEMNAMFALIENRQISPCPATDLKNWIQYLNNTFGKNLSNQDSQQLEANLEALKQQVMSSMNALAAYLSATIYLYHQDGTAQEKILQLIEWVVDDDLPFFHTHFYFAELVFLDKQFRLDNLDIFNVKQRKKIKDEMERGKTIEKHKKKLMNLTNDLLLPTMAFNSAGYSADTQIFPYIATSDRLVQLFLEQVVCHAKLGDSGKQLSWSRKKESLLDVHFNKINLPKRTASSPPSIEEISRRNKNLTDFCAKYVRKSVESISS